MTPLLSDARLARQATDGDRRAFAAIYKRYHQNLYRFCLSILSQPEDAQEALQNTMVKALRSLPGEEREIQLKPWLYRVAHNESIDLLRKRREGPELDAAQMSGAAEIAETVALRERLGGLLADLGELPERQRSALVMRELAGLGYEQIGEAFDSSAAVARQTVYEARLNLRELETGREMACDQVTRQLSEADGRVTRRRDIQAHLRNCAECRAFRDSIDSRRQDLAALSPLPAALGASILFGLASGQAATSVGGGAVAAGAGAGKVAASSVALKAVATVALVATVGVTAADRSGLIDAGLPGGKGDEPTRLEKQSRRARPNAPVPATLSPSAASGTPRRAGVGGSSSASKRARALSPGAGAGEGSATSEPNPPNRSAGTHNSSPGPPGSLPDASRHGQETAASHKASKGQGASKSHPAPPEHAQNEKPNSGKGHSAKPAPGKRPEKAPKPTQPEAKPDAPPSPEKSAAADEKPAASS